MVLLCAMEEDKDRQARVEGFAAGVRIGRAAACGQFHMLAIQA
jgi:hypothetical protein